MGGVGGGASSRIIGCWQLGWGWKRERCPGGYSPGKGSRNKQDGLWFSELSLRRSVSPSSSSPCPSIRTHLYSPHTGRHPAHPAVFLGNPTLHTYTHTHRLLLERSWGRGREYVAGGCQASCDGTSRGNMGHHLVASAWGLGPSEVRVVYIWDSSF